MTRTRYTNHTERCGGGNARMKTQMRTIDRQCGSLVWEGLRNTTQMQDAILQQTCAIEQSAYDDVSIRIQGELFAIMQSAQMQAPARLRSDCE